MQTANALWKLVCVLLVRTDMAKREVGRWTMDLVEWEATVYIPGVDNFLLRPMLFNGLQTQHPYQLPECLGLECEGTGKEVLSLRILSLFWFIAASLHFSVQLSSAWVGKLEFSGSMNPHPGKDSSPSIGLNLHVVCLSLVGRLTLFSSRASSEQRRLSSSNHVSAFYWQ